MEDFFSKYEDQGISDPDAVLSRGSVWGALAEKLEGKQLAKGATFFPPNLHVHDTQVHVEESDESSMWVELAETGNFSLSTIEGTRVPLTYAISPEWVKIVEASAARGSTWLHSLLLAVSMIEGGSITEPTAILKESLKMGHNSPIAARCLAVLSSEAETAWGYFKLAWNLTLSSPPSHETIEASV